MENVVIILSFVEVFFPWRWSLSFWLLSFLSTYHWFNPKLCVKIPPCIQIQLPMCQVFYKFHLLEEISSKTLRTVQIRTIYPQFAKHNCHPGISYVLPLSFSVLDSLVPESCDLCLSVCLSVCLCLKNLCPCFGAARLLVAFKKGGKYIFDTLQV